MKIRNIIHKGLRRFVEHDDASKLPPEYVPKIRLIISFLQDMGSEDELYSVPSWKAHKLTGNRAGIWSLFVSRNWRIMFRIEQTEIEIIDLGFEDYH